MARLVEVDRKDTISSTSTFKLVRSQQTKTMSDSTSVSQVASPNCTVEDWTDVT